MKIYIMNGWKDSPHCWKRYILKPFKCERYGHGFYINIFGITFFVFPQ